MRSFKWELTPVPSSGPGAPLDKLKPPFDLEIGCGAGDFAIQWAKKTKNPVIAIEKTKSRFSKFESQIKKTKKPENLWPIQANAVWWLAHYGKANSFQHIFLLYPNPCPKKRQAHRRWINRPFMPFLVSLLVKGGRLELRTNQNFYYEEFKEKIQSFSGLSLREERKILPAHPAQSLFEKKYLERGETCYALKYEKL